MEDPFTRRNTRPSRPSVHNSQAILDVGSNSPNIGASSVAKPDVTALVEDSFTVNPVLCLSV